jgi:hypothetical protein
VIGFDSWSTTVCAISNCADVMQVSEQQITCTPCPRASPGCVRRGPNGTVGTDCMEVVDFQHMLQTAVLVLQMQSHMRIMGSEAEWMI